MYLSPLHPAFSLELNSCFIMFLAVLWYQTSLVQYDNVVVIQKLHRCKQDMHFCWFIYFCQILLWMVLYICLNATVRLHNFCAIYIFFVNFYHGMYEITNYKNNTHATLVLVLIKWKWVKFPLSFITGHGTRLNRAICLFTQSLFN